MPQERDICCFWGGGALNYLEVLSLASFRAAGHAVTIYAYDAPPNAPEWVDLRDAGEIAPANSAPAALIADYLRYRLLAARPGAIWVKPDFVLNRPLRPEDGVLLARQSDQFLSPDIVALLPDSPALAALVEFTAERNPTPPWASEEEAAAIAASPPPLGAEDLGWGVWGAKALTFFTTKSGEIEAASPQKTFYPLAYAARRFLIKRKARVEALRGDDVAAIPLYSSEIARQLHEAERGLPKYWTPIGTLLREFDVEPRKAPLFGEAPTADDRWIEKAAPPPPAPKASAAPVTAPVGKDEKILILTAMKNEGPFILDWIGYNQSIGVDHFLVYTNDCDDQTVEILERLSELGIVTRVENPFDRVAQESPQWAAMADAVKQPKLQEADWLMMIDVDEYINIHAADGTLRGLLTTAGRPDLISMTWRFYGCGGVVAYEDKPIAEQCFHAAPKFARKPHHNWGFKTMFNRRLNYGKLGIHRPQEISQDESWKWVNGSGQPMPERYVKTGWRSAVDCWGYNLVTLNHYAVRSLDSFLVKRDRGRVNHVSRDHGLEYWAIFNRNDQEDRSILPRAQAARPYVERLKADKRLGALHEEAVAWHKAKIESLRARPDYAAFYEELAADPMTHRLDLGIAEGETPNMDASARPPASPPPPVSAGPDRYTKEGIRILTGEEAEQEYSSLVQRSAQQFPALKRPANRLSAGRNTIVTSMKNEGPFILEWIAYHLSIGFTHFLVYTNDCSDGTDEILNRLQDLGHVTRLNNPYKADKGQKPQRGALNDAVTQQAVTGADWVFVSDVDEFLDIHVGDGKIDDLVAAANDPHVISATWRFFGNGDVHRFEDGFITEQFTRCAPKFLPKPRTGWGFKSLIHRDAPYARLGVHRPLDLDEDHEGQVRWVNASGRIMPDAVTGPNMSWRSTKRTVGYELATLNHYVLRSAESFLVKRERGRVNHVDEDQGVEYWARRNYSTEVEDSILGRLPAAKQVFGDLMRDKTLAGLHKEAVAWHRGRIEDLKTRPDYKALYDRITEPDQLDAVYIQKPDAEDDED